MTLPPFFMITNDPASLIKRTFGGGFEHIVIRMEKGGIHLALSVGHKAEDSEIYFKAFLCGMYTSATIGERINVGDIISISVAPADGDLKNVLANDCLDVSLTIKRGHYLLSALILEGHDNLTITKEGKVTCSCHSEVRWIVPQAMPDYGGKFK